jgi:hypothetical protein
MQSILHNFCSRLNWIQIITLIPRAILYAFSYEENIRINKSFIGNCDLRV